MGVFVDQVGDGIENVGVGQGHVSSPGSGVALDAKQFAESGKHDGDLEWGEYPTILIGFAAGEQACPPFWPQPS
ncbi:hypothetical protein D3C78_1904830 [compost metagenome]